MSRDKFEWTDDLVLEFCNKEAIDNKWYDMPINRNDITNFKASKQPKEPERIEVSDFYIFRGSGSNRHIQFSINKEWPSQKTDAIKAAIEQVLNDDDGAGLDKYVNDLVTYLLKNDRLYPDINDSILKLYEIKKYRYTEKDLENAFNAGRELSTPHYGSGYFYVDFSIYKKHKL